MKVSGFTLVRQGVQFDYPFRESIHSLLPLVDELVINVGHSEDSTLREIRQIQSENPKIKILETEWFPKGIHGERGGLSLSEQTNGALAQCSGDWCLYLQADEVLHQDDASEIRERMELAQPQTEIDGLVFSYIHFYGSYDIIQQSRSAYRREVRAIKNHRGIQSIGDAQSFRRSDGQKINAILTSARVFHYGWVRAPEKMKEKTYFMDRLYHGEASAKSESEGLPATGTNYQYKRFWGLRRFSGTHPEVMKKRVSEKNWNWDFEGSPYVWAWKDLKKVVLDLFERLTNIRLFEYRSYRLYDK